MEIIIIDKRQNPDKDKHPYDIAYKKQFTVHESGTFGNEYVKQVFLEEIKDPRWYDEGKNHIVEGMKFSRDVDCEELFIDVGSAEELFEYLKEQDGEISFWHYQYGDDIPAIYIYNNYL